MKRIISLVLALLMITAIFASCGGLSINEDDKGAVINVYLADKVNSLDPAFAYLDESASKIIGLIFSGLFRLNDKGNVENDLCEKYTVTENPDDNYYMMEFTIKSTKWSDGRSVSANDFVYAWKRILEPSFNCEAASLLYDIKNARACKAGDASIDDLGVYAVEMTKLQVVFEGPIDYEAFKTNLASPELSPLREDKLSRLQNWASYYATMATNGPFFVKIYEPTDSSFILERNQYYFRDAENDNFDKSVTPFRLMVDYANGPQGALDTYNEGKLFFDAELPLSAREEYAKQVKTADTPYTHTYVFNTTKAPFDSADVRRGLAMALDRDAIADIVKYASAAEGYVPSTVKNGKSSGSFRSAGENVLPAYDEAQAKSLTSGAKEKSFTITVKDSEVDLAVANYAKERWEALGFKVEIVPVSYTEDTEAIKKYEYDQFFDVLRTKYYESDFDVIAVDSCAFTNDAFSLLAPYAISFSGADTDFMAGETSNPNPSGYSEDAYNEKIEAAYAEKDLGKRADILHEAEKMLADAMPAIPLFTYKDAYITKKLSGLKKTYYGTDFTKVSLSGYKEFTTLPEEL